MNKICGYSCKYNKSGICQITSCIKKTYVTNKTTDNNYKQVLNEVKEDIVFCINDMKSEYACIDKRTNRELHTMVEILKESLKKIDEVLGGSDE